MRAVRRVCGFEEPGAEEAVRSCVCHLRSQLSGHALGRPYLTPLGRQHLSRFPSVQQPTGLSAPRQRELHVSQAPGRAWRVGGSRGIFVHWLSLSDRPELELPFGTESVPLWFPVSMLVPEIPSPGRQL